MVFCLSVLNAKQHHILKRLKCKEEIHSTITKSLFELHAKLQNNLKKNVRQMKNFLTFIHKYGTWPQISMSLYDALFNAINKSIKGLPYKSKRCNNIYNILQITPRTSMSVNATYGNILFSVKVPIPA